MGEVFEICKLNDNKRLVSGWANVALGVDGNPPLDWEGDIIEPEELERAAIEFMQDYAVSGVEHVGDAVGMIVESIVFTKEKQEALGIPVGIVPEAWFITVKVMDDEVYRKVKEGIYKMFSIQGSAIRKEIV